MTDFLVVSGSSDLPTALMHLTALLLAGALTWAAVVALLASWRPTARLALALTPRAFRAALLAAISGSLALSPARAATDLDGLPLPGRGATVVPASPSPSRQSASPDEHVVTAGESLWTIAAEALGSHAPPSSIAVATTSWFEANRAVIGENPDLIHPGQVLASPDPGTER